MNHSDHSMLETIHTRLMKVTLVLEDIAYRDEGQRGPMYRLCGELLEEQCERLDEVLHPKGGAA